MDDSEQTNHRIFTTQRADEVEIQTPEYENVKGKGKGEGSRKKRRKEIEKMR